MSERPEKAIADIVDYLNGDAQPVGNDAIERTVDYIAQLEAQVDADAALWEFIRERKLDVFYDTVDDKYDAVDCDWTKGLRVYASDPDPREAVRKAMKAETEK